MDIHSHNLESLIMGENSTKTVFVSLRLKIILLIVFLISLFAFFMNFGIRSIIRNNSHASLDNRIQSAARVVDRAIMDFAHYKGQTIRALAEQQKLRQAVQQEDFLGLPILLLNNKKENDFDSLQILHNKRLVSYVGLKINPPIQRSHSKKGIFEIFKSSHNFYMLNSAPIWNGYELVGICRIDQNFIRDIEKTAGVHIQLIHSVQNLTNIDSSILKLTLKGKHKIIYNDSKAVTHLYRPFKNLKGQIIGAQLLTLFSPKTLQLQKESTDWVIKLFLLGALLAVLVAIFFSSTLLNPIRKLIQQALFIQKGDFTQQVHITSRDEIQALGETLNLMTKEIYEYHYRLEQLVEDRTRELNEANQKLQELDTMKNDFIANITHDFRSPLTVILNRADLTLKTQKDLDPKLEKTMNIIYTSSLKLKDSIDRLLDLAKMDKTGIKLRVQRTNLSTLLSSLVDFYQSATIDTGIHIKLNLPEFDVANVFTDVEKLDQVLNNIMSNALKFIDPQNGQIDILLHEEQDKVFIEISDNGIGIESENLENIFNRFEQASGGRNSEYKGTGIGLAFSKQLMEFLKGDIIAKSEGKGKGSTFVITLPKDKTLFKKSELSLGVLSYNNRESQRELIRANLIEKQNSQGLVNQIQERNKDNEFDIKKAIILIVDDNAEIREIITQYLSFHGFSNFLIASDGKIALDACYEHHPDLIISDYNMPNMRGDELHNQLASNPNVRNIPFIFLSAISDKKLIRERRERGAIAYLKKPIDENELILTVQQHLKIYFDYQKVSHLATVDELTGLVNKREILNRFHRELQVRKYRELSVIFFDIDYFKNFNDTYGHQLGDEVLKKVGKTVLTNIRTYDIAGRYGGEEFLIILPDTSLKNARLVATKLRTQLESHPLKHDSEQLVVTASFGVSSLKDYATYIEEKLDISSLESMFLTLDDSNTQSDALKEKKEQLLFLLIEMADQALYQAKRTTCLDCEFTSEKAVFENDQCPECHSSHLEKGRNRVKVFQAPKLQNEES